MTAKAVKARPPFTLPEKPVDKYRIEYYRISGYSNNPFIVHVSCVYHVNSTWLEVCPDRAGKDRKGADFVNHWQVFTDGDFTGRTRDGWDAVLHGYLGETFETYEEAKGCLLAWLERSLEGARERVSDIEKRIEEVRGAPEKTVACPTCEPKDREKNHPTGMIFVGMGHGWQPCPKCGGSSRIRPGDAHD